MVMTMAGKTKTLEKDWSYSEFHLAGVRLVCEEGSSEEEVKTYHIVSQNDRRRLGSVVVWTLESRVGLDSMLPEVPDFKLEEVTVERYAALWRLLLEKATDEKCLLLCPEDYLGDEGEKAWSRVIEHESTEHIGFGYQVRTSVQPLVDQPETLAPAINIRAALHR
jgi:hypothetical protein